MINKILQLRKFFGETAFRVFYGFQHGDDHGVNEEQFKQMWDTLSNEDQKTFLVFGEILGLIVAYFIYMMIKILFLI